MEKAMSEELNKLRADYKELLGKNAFNGWDAPEIQKRIDEALNGNVQDDQAPYNEAPKAVQTVAVTIKRDIWDGDGNRHRKGTIVDMPVEEAMDAIEAGSVSRVKG
jgi:hypothetical protein